MTLAMLLLAACGTTPVVQPGTPSSDPTTPALVGEPNLRPDFPLGTTTTSTSTTTTSTCVTTTSTTTPTTTTSTTSSTTTTTPTSTSTSTTSTSTNTTPNTTTTTTTTTSPPVPPALSLCRLDWVAPATSPSSIQRVQVVRTPDGGVVTGGQFHYSVTLGAGTTQETTLSAVFFSSSDRYIAKYDGNGVLEWTASVQGSGAMVVGALAVNASGTIAISGDMLSDAEFSPTASGQPLTQVYQPASSDQYVATLNSQGQFLWANSVSGTSRVDGGGVAIADDGTVYVNGTFSGPSDPTVGINPPGPLLSNQTTGKHAFVARFEADGSPGWGRVIGGTETEKGLGLTLDDLGNVVVMGEFNETLVVSQGEPDEQTFAPPMLYWTVENMYMASYSPTGDLVWARTGGSTEGGMSPGGVAAGAGLSLLSGSAGNSSVFGAGEPNEFAMGPDYSAYVAAYEGDGTFAYGRYIGSAPDRLFLYGTAMTPLGGIAVGGFVNGPFNFPMPNGAPPITRNTPGFGGGVFTATYLPNGALQCLLTQTGTGDLIDNRVSALSYDGADGLYVVGTYDALLTFDGVSPAVVLDAGLGQDAFVAHYTLEAP